MSGNKVTIGLAVYKFINNDIKHNLSKIETALERASSKVDIICFGETFLQGFDAFTWNYENDKDIAISCNDEVIFKLRKCTVDFSVGLMFGYLEKDEDKLYSSYMFIDKGKIIFNYRRLSKGWKEYSITDNHYCEGNDTKDFVYKEKIFRIALCGDLWEYPEKFKTKGVLLWPIYVNFSKEDWRDYEISYAKQANLVCHKALVINSISNDPDSVGGAFIFQNGRIVSSLPYDVEDILLVEI